MHLYLFYQSGRQPGKYGENNMKNLSIIKEFAGYGHYKLTTTYYGKEISYTTSDMKLIDRMNDEDERIAQAAERKAIKLIRRIHRENL